jgi:hypothetical protein
MHRSGYVVFYMHPHIMPNALFGCAMIHISYNHNSSKNKVGVLGELLCIT